MIATYYRYAIKILQDTIRFLIYKKIKKKISLIYRLVRVVLENKCRRDWKTI